MSAMSSCTSTLMMMRSMKTTMMLMPTRTGSSRTRTVLDALTKNKTNNCTKRRSLYSNSSPPYHSSSLSTTTSLLWNDHNNTHEYNNLNSGTTQQQQLLLNRRRRRRLFSTSAILNDDAQHETLLLQKLQSKEATSAWLAAGGDGRVTLHDEENTGTASFQENDDVGAGRSNIFVSMGINAYGTSTHPRIDVIERSSCTSSSPRIETFAYVDDVRSKNGFELSYLEQEEEQQRNEHDERISGAVSEMVESNRTRLMKVLGLDPDEVSVVMCASGTDAELIAAIAGIASAGKDSDAVSRWTKANQAKGSAVSKDGASLISMLLPGTGSGVGDAAGMRHHSAAAPQTDSVQPGEPIGGVVDGLIVAFEPARDGVDVTDKIALREYIDQKKTQTNAPHVLLHTIAGSKTGMHQPPLSVTDLLVNDDQSSNDILVCIDACQMRVTPNYIRDQLSKGYIVLLTGSKFYGGPPFAGACLLPKSRADEVEIMAQMDGGIPSGLASYFTKDDVPANTMPNLRQAIASSSDDDDDDDSGVPNHNAGLALRWTAALHSMERYQRLPNYLTDRVAKRWVSRVKALAEGFYPAVEVLDAPGIDSELDYRIGNVNTIVSLMIRTGGTNGGLLGVKGLKQLQLLVGTDLSDLCDDVTFPKSTKNVAKIKAQLGQPVLLGGGANHGVLRLAIGATDISEVVETATKNAKIKDDGDDDDPFVMMDALSESIDEMIINDTKLLRKVELVASHWDAVAKRFDELPASAVRWQARLAAEGVIQPTSSRRQQEVTNVDIDFLKPHEKVVNQDRVNALVDAIGRWGAYRKPLLIDRDSGSILDGHHRYFAAQQLGLKKVPAALVDYLNDDTISVELWPGDHGVESISKQDVIDMCLSADVYPPKTSKHTFTEPLLPIFVPLEELLEE